MTAQASDTVRYLGEKHALTAFSAGEPFDPKAFGYRPVMASTACWRGYLCDYEVANDALRLAHLQINHQPSDNRASRALQPPPLAGVAATPAKATWVGRWEFSEVALPLPYSGGLVIARDFLRELYVHMGFHPAWKYQHVHELLFEEGRLIEARDVSARMATIREHARTPKPTGDASRETIEAWIRDCFSRDYARKG